MTLTGRPCACSLVGGEGANNAMQDAIELADKILGAAAEGTSLIDALRAYEVGMIPRALKAVLGSRKAATDMATAVLRKDAE